MKCAFLAIFSKTTRWICANFFLDLGENTCSFITTCIEKYCTRPSKWTFMCKYVYFLPGMSIYFQVKIDKIWIKLSHNHLIPLPKKKKLDRQLWKRLKGDASGEYKHFLIEMQTKNILYHKLSRQLYHPFTLVAILKLTRQQNRNLSVYEIMKSTKQYYYATLNEVIIFRFSQQIIAIKWPNWINRLV